MKMKFKSYIHSLLITVIVLVIASFVGLFFQYLDWSEITIVLIYIISILIISLLTKGYIYGIISSIIATFLFNYFFTAPYYTLLFYDSRYFITFISMTLTSIIVSTLTSRIQLSQNQAYKNAQNMKMLYELTNHLSKITDKQRLYDEVYHILNQYFHYPIDFIFLDYHNEHKHQDIIDCFRNENQKYIIKDMYIFFPLYGVSRLLGILFFKDDNFQHMDETQKHIFYLMIDNISLALDRIYSIEEQLKLNEASIKEHYRSNLLRSISHDLRTPLSGIMGTSEMIMGINQPTSSSYHLAQDIYQEADWLYLMVQNILSLTKVQEGKLVIHKEYEAIEEVIGSAISHVQKNMSERQIEVHVPDEVMMVPMDAQLIQQVIINLLDNAFKHTSNNEKIVINAYKQDHQCYLVVEDYGDGFLGEDPQKLFEMFYTQHQSYSDSFKGVGLGLTICKAIIEAHQGTIEAKECLNHQGAQFIITLPMEDEYESNNISC